MTEPLVMRVAGQATVLQDELSNSYQKFVESSSTQPQLPVLDDGTGTPCTSDDDCAGKAASHCLLSQGTGFCTVEGCEPKGCGQPYVCCHSCNENFASFIPFEGSACVPAQASAQLEGVPGCSCE